MRLSGYSKPFSIFLFTVSFFCSGNAASAATRVFYDGSESGNTNVWNQVDWRNKCVAVQSSADGVAGPYAGSWMIRCDDNGTVEWNAVDAYESLAIPPFGMTNEVLYRARVRIDQNHDRTEGSSKKLFRDFGTNDAYHVVRSGVSLNREGVVNDTRVPTYWGVPGDESSNSSGWHVVEIYFNRATGAVKTWNDHLLVVNYNVGPFSGSVGETGNFYLTSNFSDAHDAVNYVYFDEIEVFTDSTAGTATTGSLSDASIQASTGIPTPCNTVTPSNFSQSAYNAYGAPFDVFSSNTPLINAQCTSADPHTLQLTSGITGDTTRIVYTKGYYYANSLWNQYTGTCTGAQNGDWCQGSVSAMITNPNLSTASAANPTYLVGMTCSVQGGGWKCGCRDTTCSNFSWQVQGAGM